MSDCAHDSGAVLNEAADMYECARCGSMDLDPVDRWENPDGSVSWRLANGALWTTKKYTDKRGYRLTPVMPGVYTDEAGDPHVNVAELLMMSRLEDTPENREQVLAMFGPVASKMVVLR